MGGTPKVCTNFFKERLARRLIKHLFTFNAAYISRTWNKHISPLGFTLTGLLSEKWRKPNKKFIHINNWQCELRVEPSRTCPFIGTYPPSPPSCEEGGNNISPLRGEAGGGGIHRLF